MDVKLKGYSDNALYTAVGLYMNAAAQRLLNRLCREDDAENSLALSMEMAKAELEIAQILHTKA